LDIANRAGASLELVRVHGLYAIQDPACGWLPYSPAADAAFKEQEQAYLDTITKQLGETATVPVTSALADGMVEDAILERVQTKPADLIVMTTHGRGSMSRFWLGSVAVELVRHGPVPILLVRPTAVAVSSDCSWEASPTRSCEAL
jgi:nucleotide-binding universal stress UspA family protein